jgi:cell division protein FtsL
MAWLEAELNRVQQHVSQLQTRRQELSSQVNCLTSADYFLDLDESFSSTGSTKRKPPSTW